MAVVFTACLILLLSGCGQTIGDDVRLCNPELNRDCSRCDLRGPDLSGVYSLAEADLREDKLTAVSCGNTARSVHYIARSIVQAEYTGMLMV